MRWFFDQGCPFHPILETSHSGKSRNGKERNSPFCVMSSLSAATVVSSTTAATCYHFANRDIVPMLYKTATSSFDSPPLRLTYQKNSEETETGENLRMQSQAYVALSRVRSLSGLAISSPDPRKTRGGPRLLGLHHTRPAGVEMRAAPDRPIGVPLKEPSSTSITFTKLARMSVGNLDYRKTRLISPSVSVVAYSTAHETLPL
ncbi:hypothetical protein EVAR_99153_1 [Eumeta japonica]|uniref:Uncharacterized protein n=1 Tax=Eumeta variegata TaxID=151549 RepID=A0A4C1YFY7_EUMVA|nr:hypothetical protein EVAR_99153_1 [Eumeta japonica]